MAGQKHLSSVLSTCACMHTQTRTHSHAQNHTLRWYHCSAVSGARLLVRYHSLLHPLLLIEPLTLLRMETKSDGGQARAGGAKE